jgi:hypothetical protein
MPSWDDILEILDWSPLQRLAAEFANSRQKTLTYSLLQMLLSIVLLFYFVLVEQCHGMIQKIKIK